MHDKDKEKQFSFWMPIALHFEAKIAAVKLGMNLKEYIIHLIKEDLKK